MSAFNIMWLMIMFDLPTKTDKDKNATIGFMMNLKKRIYDVAIFCIWKDF